ncbi:MAG: hypothetical protein JW932_20925 [Deltaproteobacteria bacterium]|nr:hypothetical protein [Deltaproteobacteria bacterium]
MALRLSPSLLPNLTASQFEDCDPEFAKSAIPANLKLLEGLLKNDPQNRQVLLTLCKGFCGYSLLFIEDENPLRASCLYLRAKDYGIRALGEKGEALKTLKTNEVQAWLKEITTTEIEILFWIAASWHAWIGLNLDNPLAIDQMSISQACLEKVLELKPTYFHGLPYILLGTNLAARPSLLGGDIIQAKKFFEMALDLNHRQFFLTQYYYAKYYTVRTQDKTMFINLLDEIFHNDPKNLQDVCLMNSVMQNKAKRLLESADELFF